jgi:hypothetical protein
MNMVEIIHSFDRYLADRKASFEGVAIGAGALGLLGIISRHTRDLDILDPEIPASILDHARSFAEQCRQNGLMLSDGWLNNGPMSLTRDLPEGWQNRIQLAYQGKALTIHTLGRLDLLRSKLFALCDRGTDLTDCLALAPTQVEIHEIIPWLEIQDGNPDWPDHVREVLEDLQERAEHGL